MFKHQPKHVFTCDDVIYLQKKAKRNKKITYAIVLTTLAGLWMAGSVSEMKTAAQPELDTTEPTDD